MLLSAQAREFGFRCVALGARAFGAPALGLELRPRSAQLLGRVLDRGLCLAQRLGALSNGSPGVGTVGALVKAAQSLAYISQPLEAALQRLELLEAAGEAPHQPLVNAGQAGRQLLGDAVWVKRL